MGSTPNAIHKQIDQLKQNKHARLQQLASDEPSIFLPTDIDVTLDDILEQHDYESDSLLDNYASRISDNEHDHEQDDVVHVSFKLKKDRSCKAKNSFQIFKMQFLIWNVRGPNDPIKVKKVSELIRVHHPAILALSETKKMDFSPSFLDSLVNYGNFCWHHLPAVGTAGGILMGVDLDIFAISGKNSGCFYISCDIRNKIDNFCWRFVAVYGPAYEELKQDFLDELNSICASCSIPILVGGDFNLIRLAAEKSSRNINQSWADKFNNWVNAAALMELKPTNRRFTWSNNQDTPIMAAIDKKNCLCLLGSSFSLLPPLHPCQTWQ